LTKIFLIRHAEAEGNKYRRAHGHLDGMVTDRGYLQIGQLKDRFKNERIDAVYSSDLARARMTAEALSQPRGLQVVTTDRLREVYMGSWEDRPWGEMEYLEPKLHSYFSSDPAKWIVSGGENYLDVMARVTRCIKELAARHDGETIAVVSHGFAIRVFFCGLMGLESHEAGKVLYCDNTAVALLHYVSGDMTIEYQSDNSHLNHENSTFAHQNWWRGEKSWKLENLRFMPLDTSRDSELLALYEIEAGSKPLADMEYAAFLADEEVGMLGINVSDGCAGNGMTCAETEPVSENAGRVSYMYLKPEHRRLNLSVQLLGQAISDLRKLGKDHIRVDAASGSPVFKMCLRDGFEVLSESDGMCRMQKKISTLL